jgi:Domain of unknown function (DUF4290)
MKEYGTNVQKLVNYIMTITDREQRTKYAYLLIELMKQVHPNMRDGQDYSNKLWDDLYIMSEFKLDVESPFPPPPIDAVGKRPKSMPYNTHNLKYKHYGRNVELLIEKAIATENEEEKIFTVSYICRLMKSMYISWNKEIVEEAVIYNQLAEMASGKLNAVLAIVKEEGVLEKAPRFHRQQTNVSTARTSYSRNPTANSRHIRTNQPNKDRNGNGGARNYRSK